MKNKQQKNPSLPKKTTQGKLKPPLYLLMLAYALVPVFVPNFNTFDSNGPKFLALAIINLVAFVVLFTNTEYKNRPELGLRFFRSFIGIAYTMFLVISMLSFFNAINRIESLLNIVKMLTVFAAAYVLYVIFSSNRGYLSHLAVVLTILLLLDSLTVFYNMRLYIFREVASIMDIKSVYSHKNVLASAIFVKIPVAMYLIFFSNGWQKRLGYIAGFSAVLATLLLSTRAFYIGLVLLLVALLLYALIRHRTTGNKGYLRMIASWAGMVALAILLYTGVQRLVFPKNTDRIWNTGIVTRLSSIDPQESSTNARLSSWKRSIQLILDHPVLGVGTGNWKLAVLKYENRRSPDFRYQYKNHNDFLEITAETGLPGGLAFIAIIILVMVSFVMVSTKTGTDYAQIKLLFIPAFGMLAYSVDAFFNFPADRPEIQSLFAVYLGIAIAFSKGEIQVDQVGNNTKTIHWIRKYRIQKIVAVTMFVFLIAFCWILALNVKSLYYQRLAYKDMKPDQYTYEASFFINGFPSVPTVSSYGEPIAVIKAKYLIKEHRYKEAVTLLLSDMSSPYDSRREFHLSLAYVESKKLDSAFTWMQKAYQLKPFHDQAMISLSAWMYERGMDEQALRKLKHFLQYEKTNKSSWRLTESILWANDQKEKAILLLDSALQYFPRDTAFINLKKYRIQSFRIAPYEMLYNRIFIAFNKGAYPEATNLLTEFIEKKPDFPEAYENRAICYSMTGEYAESIKDIDETFRLGRQNYDLLNLRGENFRMLGNLEAACRDYKTAMDKGDENAARNYKKYCLNQ